MLYKITELVALTGLSRATLYRLKDEGMPTENVVGQRKYDLAKVKAFISERLAKSGTILCEGYTYTNAEIAKCFRIGRSGKVRKSTTQDKTILFSDAEDSEAEDVPYDRFGRDGLLYFTVLGDSGARAVRRLQSCLDTNAAMYLFMRRDIDAYVFRGLAVVEGSGCTEVVLDEGDELCNAVTFPLRLLSEESCCASARESCRGERAGRTARLDSAELFALNEKILARNNANKAAGHGLPGARRDPRVASYALMRANGRCQLCGTEVDALDICKPLNLVCHHEPPLEEGGWDDKMHTAALCPNCHARRHDEKCLSQQMGYSEMIAQNIALSEELFRAGLSVSDKKGL